MLIGLTGAAGCGKSTVSRHLRLEHRFFDLSLADPIYGMVASMTGMTVDALKNRAIKEQKIDWLGLSPRELLQRIGTEFGRCAIDDGVWIRHLMRRVDATTLAAGSTEAARFVISDVRFDNEAEAIKSRGGEVWAVVRAAPSCLRGSTAAHASEAGVASHLVDRVIENNGTLKDLGAAVDDALAKATGAYN